MTPRPAQALVLEPAASLRAKPLAIIIQGNPKFLNDPQIAPWANAFHARIARLFEEHGWLVEMDAGAPMTQPRGGASAWIGHSRGVDRLRFAGPSIQIHALLTLSDDGAHPDHYQLASADAQAISRIAGSLIHDGWPAPPKAAIRPP